MSTALNLVHAAKAAGVRLEARFWCDAPDRLAPELRDQLAALRPAVLRLLLDQQVGDDEARAAEADALAPEPPCRNDDPRRQAMLDGYRPAAQRRPPSLPVTAPPGARCFCTCCAGRAWWTEREALQGRRCSTWYPAAHLALELVRALRM